MATKPPPTLTEMQDMEVMAVKLLETARKLPPGRGTPKGISVNRAIPFADSCRTTKLWADVQMQVKGK